MADAQIQQGSATQPQLNGRDVPSFLPLSFDPNLLGPPGPSGAQQLHATRQQFGGPGRHPPRGPPAGMLPPKPYQQPMPGGFGGLPAAQHGMPHMPPDMMQQQQFPPGMPLPPMPPQAAAAGGWPGAPGYPGEPYDAMASAAANGAMHPAAAGNKRRRRDAAPLDAEAQLLLLGFLSAVVGDSNTLNQCLVSAVGLETQQEQQRRAAAAAGMAVPMPPPPKLGVLGSYQLAQKLANELRGRPALSLVWQLQLQLDTARSMLALGGACTLDDLRQHIASDLHAVLASLDNEGLPGRRAKVEAQCELSQDALRDVAEQLLQEAGHIEKPAAAVPRTITVYKPLPRCIIENKEPFAHKDWRREPFDPRPYIPLTEYAITSKVASEAKALRWKLTTRRADGADGGFAEKHSDLPPEELQDKEQHLVKQVVARQALIQGVDVVEVDTWGMDCYTRRNVFDAVLEADVFKHLRPEQEEFEPDPELDALEAQQQLDAALQQQRPKRKKKKKKHFKELRGSSSAAASRQQSAAGGGGGGGGAAVALKPPPQIILDIPELPVMCNTTPGTFLFLEMRVLCNCNACLKEPDLEARKWMPTKFEQHAGAGSSKKWRASIRIPPGAVEQCPADAQPMQIGKWMDEMGIDSKVPKMGPAWLLPGAASEVQQQQQAAEQQPGSEQQQGAAQQPQQLHGQQQQQGAAQLDLQQEQAQQPAGQQEGSQQGAPQRPAQPMDVDVSADPQRQQLKQEEQQQPQQQLQQPVKTEADAAATAAASSPQPTEVKPVSEHQHQQPDVKPKAEQAESQPLQLNQEQQQQQQEATVKVEATSADAAAAAAAAQVEPQLQQPVLPAGAAAMQQQASGSHQPHAQPAQAAAEPLGQQQQDPQLIGQQQVPEQQLSPQQQQQQQQSSPGQQSREASTAPAAGTDAAAAAGASAEPSRDAAAGDASSSGEEVSGSDESSDDEEGGIRRSSRSRKRVVYADEAAGELEATTAAAREAAREAARDKMYGTRRIKYGDEEKDAVHGWIDRVFIPAINRAGPDGWDMVKVATDIKLAAEATGSETDAKAAAAILRQFERLPEGYNYFRLHPKGRGMLVARPGGIQPFTFVEEYLGEVHTGWRWFEIQDAIKKITQKDLPDFYNITLERPKDDPDGYDVMFVDAAFMGSFASRMSHSCSPNCQAVVVSAGGRLTVALYTIRHVAPGEELTFDYASVTESEDEFKQAFCMCSTRQCRGSYLHYTGKAYMQVVEEQHTFLDRQVSLLRCSLEPLNDEDKAALHAAGLRGSALGRADVAANPEVPDWLKKWVVLTLEFVQKEKQLLPGALQALPPPLTVSEPDSVSAAVGVELNRLQNICITLDKAKHCLNQPGQCKEAPLGLLGEEEVVEHLWSGDKSVAKRAAAAAAAFALEPQHAELLISARTPEQYTAVGQALASVSAPLAAMSTLLAQPAADPAAARALLAQLVVHLRELDVSQGGGHTRTADVLALYAATQVWFTSTRDYISFTSPPLQLHEDMISMHGGFAGPMGGQPRRTSSQGQLPPAAAAAGAGSSGFAPYGSYSGSNIDGWGAGEFEGGAQADGGEEREREGVSSKRGRGRGRGRGSRGGGAASGYKRGADSDDEYDPDKDSFSGSSPGSSELDSDDDSRGRARPRGRGGRGGRGRGRGSGGEGPAGVSLRDISRKVLEKRYGPLYVWAQLSSWYKQTVYDPTASLSAERRGTLSLPDIESCYNTKEKYDARERSKLISHIESQPERQWTSSCWSFRNEAKVYGSPMFDALWFEALQGTPRSTSLEQLAEALRSAPVPTGGTGGLGRGGGRAGRGRGGGRGGRGGRGRGGRSGGRGGRRRATTSDGDSSDEGGMELDDYPDAAAAAGYGAAAAGFGAAGYEQYPAGHMPGVMSQQWQQ